MTEEEDLLRRVEFKLDTIDQQLEAIRLRHNAVHFTILMEAAKSTRTVGCGVRGRSL
jgi:hypothetical protein